MQEQFDPIRAQLHSIVRLDANYERPPIALSIGDYQGRDGNLYPIPYATLGDISSLIGYSKTFKSTLLRFIEACYLGGNANEYFPNIRSHREPDAKIIYFDTEQKKYDVHRSLKLVKYITKLDDADLKRLYKVYSIRTLSPMERIEFIDYVLENESNVRWVTIDQVADLVTDVNNLPEANELITKLMQWCEKFNIHLATVIHTNFTKDLEMGGKPTGHLGSAITKKCETVAEIKIDPEQHTKRTVNPKHTRNYPFGAFSFEMINGLLYQCENDDIPL